MTEQDRAVHRGLEHIQRAHEIGRALDAARKLQERLEMLGDREADVAVVRSLRDSLSRDLDHRP